MKKGNQLWWRFQKDNTQASPQLISQLHLWYHHWLLSIPPVGNLYAQVSLVLTFPPRSGSRNLDQQSPSSCITLRVFLRGCYSRYAIIALLAGVRTVCRWPAFTVLWCYTFCLTGMQVLSSKHFSVRVTLTRTIKCEFQYVLCIAWSLHHNYVLLYAVSWEQLICLIITTDNIAEKCYPIYGDMWIEINGSGHTLCKIFNFLFFFDKESHYIQLCANLLPSCIHQKF